MREGRVTELILESTDEQEIVTEVHLEKQIGEPAVGIADIVFPKYKIAVECKGKPSNIRKGIGQAHMYKSTGHRSVLALPSSACTAQLYDALSESPIGLISVDNITGDINVHHDISKGWPFPHKIIGRPEKRNTPNRESFTDILTGGVAKGKWKSKI